MNYKIKEIESSYLNLSIALYTENLFKVIKKYGKCSYAMNEFKGLILSYKINERLEKEISYEDIKEIIRLLHIYNRVNTGYPKFILRDFIHVFIDRDFKKICKITSNSLAFEYVNYNFNLEPFLKHSKQNPDIVKERIIEYASAFYYFYLIIMLYKALNKRLKRNKYVEFCYYVHIWLSYGVLSGFKVYTELELPFSYAVIAEELSYLTSNDKERLVITNNPENGSIEFKIKNNIIFQERYESEGYGEIFYDEDFKKDRNLKNIFRITKGSRPNSVKLIYKRASGQRTIGRIFSFRGAEKINVSKFYDKCLYGIKNMIIFCLFAILENCNCRGIKFSKQNEINEFIKSLKNNNKRYLSEKISVIVLMVLHPELKKEIIKKYYKHKIQREEILKGVEKLEAMIKTSSKSYFYEFLKALRRNYVW